MKIYLLTVITVAVVFPSFKSSAQPPGITQPNLVQNGSFESSPPSLSPWVGTAGLALGFPDAADGRNYATITGYLYQEIPTISGQAYQLQFAMAGNFNWPAPITMTTFWGGNMVASTTWNPAGHSVTNLGWIDVDITVVATDFTTHLEFDNPGANLQNPYLDAVSLVAVPEPTCASLIMIIGGTVFLVRRRGKQSSA